MSPPPLPRLPRAAVVGGGPAGLAAATMLGRAGAAVDVYESMPSVGRKLLVAGVGGLNLTNAEPRPLFASRFGEHADRFAALLEAFSPDDLRAFVSGLGIETIVGSGGRVFPRDLKASPLLRAWVRKLKGSGVAIHTRYRLVDLGPGPRLRFAAPHDREVEAAPAVAILALGGATWRRLGSDGLWSRLLAQAGVPVKPFRPSNCGFEVAWSKVLRERVEGRPLKNVAVAIEDPGSPAPTVKGELLITRYGLEGGALYALSPQLRARIDERGRVRIAIDLKPALDEASLAERLIVDANTNPRRTVSERLRRSLRLDRTAILLLHEVATRDELSDPRRAARLVKALPLELRGVRPLDEAISSAGGVAFEGVDDGLMLRALPGVFVAGEMLDYDPPTGGYLLQAAFSTGVRAAKGALEWLGRLGGEA